MPKKPITVDGGFLHWKMRRVVKGHLDEVIAYAADWIDAYERDGITEFGQFAERKLIFHLLERLQFLSTEDVSSDLRQIRKQSNQDACSISMPPAPEKPLKPKRPIPPKPPLGYSHESAKDELTKLNLLRKWGRASKKDLKEIKTIEAYLNARKIYKSTHADWAKESDEEWENILKSWKQTYESWERECQIIRDRQQLSEDKAIKAKQLSADKLNQLNDLRNAFEIIANSVPRYDNLERPKPSKNPQAKKLNWRLLPTGGAIVKDVLGHINAQKTNFPSRKCDESRIQLIEQLKPTECYVGIDEFDGYYVFLFGDNHDAVLESPWVGNALYLLRGNWRELSKMPKSMLLADKQDHVERLIHRSGGKWYSELKRKIKPKRLPSKRKKR
jgi:hypothetical protein